MTSVDSNFNFLCGRPHGAGPPPPVNVRPPEPDPLPIRVDVISGWPLIISFNVQEYDMKTRSKVVTFQK